MTTLDFGLNIGLGLAGSLHCVQMCGPVILAWSLPSSDRTAASHFAYHAGRIATYSLLGALAGTFGRAISSIAKWEAAASLVAGSLMLIAGLLMLGALRRPQLVQISGASWLTRTAGRWIRSAPRIQLGALMGLLPCGLLYAALIKSMAPGNAIDGALTMLGFGVGTMAPLLVLGLGSVRFGRSLGRWSVPISAASVTLLGLFLVARGLAPVTFGACPHHH